MAKKVSVGTIRDLVKTLGVNGEKEVEYEGVKFTVLNYLPIEKKKAIVELIVKNAFVSDASGFKRYDKAIENIMLDYLITREYTNINVMGSPFEMYDAITSTGVIQAIRQTISEIEINELEGMLDYRVEEEFRLQELSTSLGHKLEGLIGMLDSKMGDMLGTLSNFDPTDLNMLTSFLNTDEYGKVVDTPIETLEKPEIIKGGKK